MAFWRVCTFLPLPSREAPFLEGVWGYVMDVHPLLAPCNHSVCGGKGKVRLPRLACVWLWLSECDYLGILHLSFFLSWNFVSQKEKKHLIIVLKTKAGPFKGEFCAEAEESDGHWGITHIVLRERGDAKRQKGWSWPLFYLSLIFKLQSFLSLFFHLWVLLFHCEFEQNPLQISTNHLWIFFFFSLCSQGYLWFILGCANNCRTVCVCV